MIIFKVGDVMALSTSRFVQGANTKRTEQLPALFDIPGLLFQRLIVVEIFRKLLKKPLISGLFLHIYLITLNYFPNG